MFGNGTPSLPILLTELRGAIGGKVMAIKMPPSTLKVIVSRRRKFFTVVLNFKVVLRAPCILFSVAYSLQTWIVKKLDSGDKVNSTFISDFLKWT